MLSQDLLVGAAAAAAYARGMKSESRHRSTLDLRAKFTDDQKAFHDLLTRLRDDAVAHYGPGPLPSGFQFHEEKLLLPVDREEGSSIMMVSRRTCFAPDFIERFRVHLSRSLLLVQREVQKRELGLMHEIFNHPDRPALESVLRSNVRPASHIMGSDAAQDALLTGAREGGRTVYQSNAGWSETRRS